MNISDTEKLSELELLNFFLNLLKENAHVGVINILCLNNYTLFSIEKNVRTEQGTIKFDICFKKDNAAFYGLELKGGRFDNDISQIEKYNNFERTQYLRNETLSHINQNNFSVHIIFNIQLNNTIDNYMENLIYSGFTFRNNKIIFECETELFKLINEAMETTDIENIQRIIHFDKETEDKDIANEICSEVDALLMNQCSFTIDEIVSRAYCSIPDMATVIGADVRSFGNKKVKKMLDLMGRVGYTKLMKWENRQWHPLKTIKLNDVKIARRNYLEYINNPFSNPENNQMSIDEFIE
ncbi:hypothetical protein [Macrococcus carouselicus]|uniref:Uncharacterized protein n=1 Tax=Macrococcus carouselicus TaxID=69969 RepID=A0A9Q8CKN7_9STAP|nr:hypothetical protein [Macrococcus carouselicus]TDM04694.1 hypothetical protein ERX40_05910 [Macrococcus carouselicus]